MHLIRLFLLLPLLLTCTAFAQNVVLQQLTPLPAGLSESSGLAVSGPQLIWSHNDSGGDPALLAFDTNGTLLRTLTLSNATNIDWEDLARDDMGNLYIGDFGNNGNDRQDQRIYRVTNPSLIVGNTTTAALIDFSFADQPAFPPTAAQLNYDVEAMIWLRDSLFLFTKNRTAPFDGYTRLYGLPALPGTQVASLIDSFYTGPGPKELWWITAADLSPDGRHLALLSSDKLWLFSCFDSPRFFSGSVRQFNFALSQKEGIAFRSNEELLITDELLPILGGANLYRLDLSPWLPLVDLEPDTLLTADSLVLDAGDAGTNFLWSTGDTTQTLTVFDSGSYWVALSFANGCTATDTIQVSFLNTAISPKKPAPPLRLSPNPTRETLQITGDFQPGIPVQVSIWSARGRRVLQQQTLAEETGILLRLPPLATGLYIVEIKQGNHWQSGRVHVE